MCSEPADTFLWQIGGNMYIQAWILCSIFIPAAAGLLFLVLPARKMREKKMSWAAVLALVLTVASVGMLLFSYSRGTKAQLTLFSLTEGLDISFRLDDLGAFFLGFIAFIWLLGGIFSVEYLNHEHHKRRFWGFYLLTLCALQGLSLAGNLVTMYLFFEMMTLVSMPLVLHTQTHEAVMAGLKYLFYSMCGAYMALFGVFVFYHFGKSMEFLPGGVMDSAVLAQNGTILHLGIFLMILGFGVKAGMFPMHAWLPTAHPVAPAPASAVLSAIIVKGGVLAVMRSVYYVAGAELLKGSWVQYAWLILALITIFLGSMLAFKEPVLKKRLAYSSVSQASYIMLGMAVLNPTALTGSLLHVLFHAFIKTALFLSAGAVIYQTGYTRVGQLRGIGKEMPVTIWCYTFVSLALIGIPPASGFISKWYLAEGLLESSVKTFSWLGPVVLLVSALLTAGYLLPVTIDGFLPGEDYNYQARKKREPSVKMVLPLIILAAGALIMGVFPGGLITFLGNITAAVV